MCTNEDSVFTSNRRYLFQLNLYHFCHIEIHNAVYRLVFESLVEESVNI